MVRRLPVLCALALLLAATRATARPFYVSLAPASLAGAAVFTAAEQLVVQAARDAQLAFTPDPRPLPPQVILTLDTPAGDVRARDGIFIWRGDMLPDQLEPGESGTFLRKRRTTAGQWKTMRRVAEAAPDSLPRFAPVGRSDGPVPLPALIIETPYHLGILGDLPVTLVLWRIPEEGSPPLGGALVLENPSAALAAALEAAVPAFPARAAWTSEFDARAP
jgi:hypothetical protein